MSFDTLNYYIFFPLFFLAYWLFPFRWRVPLMLVGSYYFYACVKPIYLILIVFSTLVDYFCSRKIESGISKKKYLWISLGVNLSLLSIFKYLDFSIAVLNDLISLMNFDYSIPLQKLEFPIGISFYTLQTLSYTIDVYRGDIPAEKNIFKFSLFVCFFPQLVAGPLERAGKLLPQFSQKREFNYDRAVDGILLILWGLIKKTVVSDRLVLIIESVYKNENHSYSGIHFALVGLMISAKFYGDFSGYSDMAVGSAKLLGIELSKNFDIPFWSTSITKFWRKWHVTLSNWLHDYLYLAFPISKTNRNAPVRYLAVLAVFIVSGLWHGPAWTFVIWGTINGVLCLIYMYTSRIRDEIANLMGFQFIPSAIKGIISVAITNTLVGFTMIFFMSPNLKFATSFLRKVFSEFSLLRFEDFLKAYGYFQNDLIIATVVIAIIELLNFAKNKNMKFTNIRCMPIWFRWPTYIVGLSIFLILSYTEKSAFSYFYY
ncbi:MAG: membrane-bound O-acyltransferase family protein [Bdellovibrio sp. CG12_big_fil_rev_8_21_14_0_65_39_13]|nr:MAG: membrane-bound O-acyltransferase family protein [Bdellovibrio sp. CG22_combo_CG10-13_8_21_14_all_39_27]PIQ58098.1 MAG: membrane-bound O-acyltransferase family protein [Bdellovibrio sp. CG12_big_fil_rev_8_21_14_0_65_39_13]PIR32973.1 MAG: membrane-bound O-acyltransferase family protein [Bdellovibrio sp. CG11_big_fil_rev_8_21_14_0_20_39_38]PJB52673.1 MAG: membrane-bound O-acyltransferase family protein [Bdellovibrio sp. CG_4_9_14_3_um_filter_39_7]